jgi:putative ABC transport system permease protein
MNFFESIKVSYGALAQNKLRSFLTMLGVIIGVGAVIALVSLGRGAQKQVESQITALGSNLITVSAPTSSRLEPEDMYSILERVPTVSMATPVVAQAVTAKVGTLTYDTRIEGVSPHYAEIRNYSVLQGKFFDEDDLYNRRKVAVLGYTVYQEMFGNRRAIGETINIRGEYFLVIGITAQKGAGMQEDYDDKILIPYTTAQRMFGTRYLSTMVFKANSSEVAPAATSHITRILEDRFRQAERDNRLGMRIEPFRVFSQDQLLDTMSQTTGTFTMLLAGIAAVSLLVGGIGIMNIMLVSVTERTREIGIRKALGATKRDIVMQFLMEALMLSAFGGLVGVLFGTQLASLLGRFGGIPVSVAAEAVAVSFGFASFIGVFFGMYPAVRASNLDPIVALRYE